MESAYDRTLGLRLVEAGDGKAVYTFEAGPQHHNPTGRVHGGAITSLADAAMGAAFMSLASGDGTNINVHVQFTRAVTSGTLTATAEVVHAGRTRCLVRCDVTDHQGQTVATASSDFLRLQENAQTIGS